MKPTRPLAFVLLALATPSALAQTCASGPPSQLGSVTVVSTNCSPGNVPLTTCRVLRVECDGLPPLDVQLRVSEPEPQVALRGTVVLGTGGGGTDFYSERVGGPALFQELRGHGFRLVERAWGGGGWFGSGVSVRKQSCRYATLLAWVRQSVHTTGVFCATGNSGGSGEIGYALTAWGSGALLDVAVPSGGPPMARLDYLCNVAPEWRPLCPTVVPPEVTECARVQCFVEAGHGVCTGCGPAPTAADLRADSVLHPGAVLGYPRTRVHVLLGGRDCTSAVPAGVLFFNAVTSEKVLEWVPGTPHWAAETTEGRAAIVRALLGGAACRPGPATLAAPAWPRVGGSLQLDAVGPPGGAFVAFLSPGATLLEAAPVGWIFLAFPIVPIGGGALDPVGGRGSLLLGVPPEPALAGLAFFAQAVSGTCLTNLVRVEVQP